MQGLLDPGEYGVGGHGGGRHQRRGLPHHLLPRHLLRILLLLPKSGSPGVGFRQWTLDESYLAWALPSFSWRLRHVFPRFSNSHFVWRRNGYFSRDSRSYLLKLFGIFITKSVRNLANRRVDNSMHHEGGSLSNDLWIQCDHLGNLSLKGFHL